MTRHHSRRVSPFGHPRIHARLTTPRGISQPPTSFIGPQCQGIHHAPLHTYNTKPKVFELKNSKLHINTQNRQPTTKGKPTPMRARCSQPLSTNQTPHPTTKAGRQQPNPQRGSTTGLLPQSPIVCPMIFSPPRFPRSDLSAVAPTKRPLQAPAHISQPRTPHRCEARGKRKRCSLERR